MWRTSFSSLKLSPATPITPILGKLTLPSLLTAALQFPLTFPHIVIFSSSPGPRTYPGPTGTVCGGANKENGGVSLESEGIISDVGSLKRSYPNCLISVDIEEGSSPVINFSKSDKISSSIKGLEGGRNLSYSEISLRFC